MRTPHPPNATRFFARPLQGVLECPRCGQILTFASRSGRRGSTQGWHPKTSQLDCWNCHLVMVIGVIAWPVQAGSWGRTLPKDQVPEERQLAQMRAMGDLGPGGAGWWMPKDQAVKARRAEHTNLTAACLCGEASDGTPRFPPHRSCPIHGEMVQGEAGWEIRGKHKDGRD